jgi:primosomal protein N''
MGDSQDDQIKKLEQRLEQLERRTSYTSPFDVAREVFSSLELYRRHHASSQPYQAHVREILSMLRHLSQNSEHGRTFYAGLADTLEKYNWPSGDPSKSS